MIRLQPTIISDVQIPALYLFEGEKANYVLNPDNGTGILVDALLAKAWKKNQISEKLLEKIISRGLTGCTFQDKCGVLKAKPSFFLIDMTNNCNFSCRYCLRDAKAKHCVMTNEMLTAILDSIITYCRKNNEQHISIQPWGGEPLLELEKILSIREKMQRDAPDLHVNISVETNGSLITADVARKLIEANIGIGISIDGPREIHNAQRITVQGHETFDAVMQGIRNMQEAGDSNLGSISVITREHVSKIGTILEFFAHDLPGVSIKINPMRSPGNTEAINNAVTPEDMPFFIENLVNGIVHLMKNGIRVSEGNVSSALRNLLCRDPHNICKSHGCQGGWKMIIFDQRGDYYPCEMVDRPEERIGNISDSQDFNEAIQAAAEKHEFFKRKEKPECQLCPWKYYCQGGCTSALLYQHGRLEGVDEVSCSQTKELYQRIMTLIIQEPKLAISLAGLEPIRRHNSAS